MADRPLTLMAVHAHPDDEATGTGGVLARYAAEGIRTVLVTCTDGRCGDGPGGVKPGEPGHDPAAVVAMRRAELEASCAVLGVSHLELLGYADSGMMGWPQQRRARLVLDARRSTRRPRRLAELMRPATGPTSSSPTTRTASTATPTTSRPTASRWPRWQPTGIPAKVYWTTVPALDDGGVRRRSCASSAATGTSRSPSERRAGRSRSACPTRRSPPGSTPPRSAARSSTRSPRTPARARTSSSCGWARSGSPS